MISLVIPCYNETDVLELTYGTLELAIPSFGEPVEIILIDDGSRDNTWEIITRLAERDPRVRGLKLSRNFGHQAAVGAGLEAAQGDAIVVLDADLQDPPALINDMLAQWRAGYDVVFAQRNQRLGESTFKKATAWLFYKLLSKINTVTIPRNTGEFCLMDARVVRALLSFREHAMFWRGLRSWSGFRHTAVKFDRPPRAGGETKYTLRKMLALASNGLLSFSHAPLQAAFYAGFTTLALTALAVVGSAAWWLFGPEDALWPVEGGTLALCFLGGVQLLCLGMIGEYLNRVYDEVRDRPRWIVDSTVGLAEQSAPSLLAYQRRRKAG